MTFSLRARAYFPFGPLVVFLFLFLFRCSTTSLFVCFIYFPISFLRDQAWREHPGRTRTCAGYRGKATESERRGSGNGGKLGKQKLAVRSCVGPVLVDARCGNELSISTPVPLGPFSLLFFSIFLFLLLSSVFPAIHEPRPPREWGSRNGKRAQRASFSMNVSIHRFLRDWSARRGAR